MTEASLLLKNIITISISNIKANICKACILARNISLMNFAGLKLGKERLDKNIIQPFWELKKRLVEEVVRSNRKSFKKYYFAISWRLDINKDKRFQSTSVLEIETPQMISSLTWGTLLKFHQFTSGNGLFRTVLLPFNPLGKI